MKQTEGEENEGKAATANEAEDGASMERHDPPPSPKAKRAVRSLLAIAVLVCAGAFLIHLAITKGGSGYRSDIANKVRDLVGALSQFRTGYRDTSGVIAATQEVAQQLHRPTLAQLRSIPTNLESWASNVRRDLADHRADVMAQLRAIKRELGDQRYGNSVELDSNGNLMFMESIELGGWSEPTGRGIVVRNVLWFDDDEWISEINRLAGQIPSG